jgi:hypothetical protein
MASGIDCEFDFKLVLVNWSKCVFPHRVFIKNNLSAISVEVFLEENFWEIMR